MSVALAAIEPRRGCGYYNAVGYSEKELSPPEARRKATSLQRFGPTKEPLAAEDSQREINVYINSPGGTVTAGLAIYDTMRILPCPVATTCVGFAASFGTIVLMAGDKGLRRSLPHARIHIHQPLIHGGIAGQATDIDIHAREILHTRDVLNEIIQHHTGQSLERIKRDTERDFFMSAFEAIEYGIIDEVLPLAEK